MRKNGWHDTDKEKPKRDEIVVGFWFHITETIAELCYYDHDTREWFSGSPGSSDCALSEPDYWIETPYQL
jgi:hypothetical protein